MARRVDSGSMRKSAASIVAGLGLAALGLLAAAAGERADMNDVYPKGELTSIFRDDFAFFHPGGEPDPSSVPPARPGCGVKLLNTGEESFRWRYKMLKRADYSIRLQTYIFTGDKTGERVADRLKRARRRGVEVKLIVDAYTKFKFPDRRMYADLELRGVTVMGFEPLYLLGVYDDRILNVSDVNKRFHEKYWVIDDEVAFLGGTNIANEYARWGDDPNDMWRDQDVMLTGPVVDDVARAFDENYEYFVERRLDRLLINQPSVWARLWWAISGTGPETEVEQDPADLPAAQLNDSSATVRLIRARPRLGEDHVYQAHLHLLSKAEKSILIENAYFVPNRPLMSLFKEAAARGVEVTIITNSAATNDVDGMQPLSRYSYLPLIEAGVKIMEWQGDDLDNPGYGSLHSKFAIIDGRVTVIGSFNLDPRSIYLNSEDVVIIDSVKTASDLFDFARSRDIPRSETITIEQARRWRDPADVRERFRLKFGMAIEEWY